jgi:hypothetical protein
LRPNPDEAPVKTTNSDAIEKEQEIRECAQAVFKKVCAIRVKLTLITEPLFGGFCVRIVGRQLPSLHELKGIRRAEDSDP